MSNDKNTAEKRERQAHLWKAFAQTRDASVKEQLILEYAPVIKFVAGRLAAHIGAHVEFEDMMGYGIFGLIDAIDKFDPHKGAQFETYASLRIRGAIIDGMRKMDWAPRALRLKTRHLETVYQELETELGREPTDDELGRKLGVSAEEARDLIAKHAAAAVVSLDDFLLQNTEAQIVSDAESPEDAAVERDTHRLLTAAIDKLNPQERTVVAAYYYEEMTLKEISAILGVSESRVSQIHSKAVLKLRVRMGAPAEEHKGNKGKQKAAKPTDDGHREA